jgi:hypothetical protein
LARSHATIQLPSERCDCVKSNESAAHAAHRILVDGVRLPIVHHQKFTMGVRLVPVALERDVEKAWTVSGRQND